MYFKGIGQSCLHSTTCFKLGRFMFLSSVSAASEISMQCNLQFPLLGQQGKSVTWFKTFPGMGRLLRGS